MRTKVSSRGQTAVPAEVRRRFGLTERSQLEWLIDGDLITVLPIPPDRVRAFRGVLKNRYSTQALRRGRARDRAHEKRRG
jgi:AbrB family looped-hinge helix DNA binding protein